MSTKKKESVSSVKEKRGSSPSHSHSPLSFLKSSPKPKTSTSRSLDSSPSDKSTPNYLKPTLSSSLSSGDTTKLQGRKPVSNTDSGLKSNLARRRSFDKPPSPTRTHKSRGVSPTPGRAGASPKSERILKGAKEGGKHVHHLYARAVGALKKSASKSKKGETSTAKEPKPDDDHHTAEDDAIDESPIGEDENQVVADQEMEQTHGETDEDALEDESHEQDADEVELSPTVLEQHEATAESPTNGEDEIVPKAESPTVVLGQDDAEKDESPTATEQEEMEENSTNDDDQSVAGTPKEEAEEGEEEEDTNAEGEDGARLSHGKKDAGLSNDVIEEMTREQRRNKVRALAGAFETVISLQDHKKS